MDDNQIERVAILIDGPNLYNMALRMAIRIDYLKLVQALTIGRRAVVRNIYCIFPFSTPMRKFHRKLRRYCHLNVIHGQINEEDIDDYLAEDIILYAQNEYIDTIIVVAGDGGYEKHLRSAHEQMGKMIEIVSIKDMVSHDYYLNGYKVIDLREIRALITENFYPRRKKIGPSGKKRHTNHHGKHDPTYLSRRMRKRKREIKEH